MDSFLGIKYDSKKLSDRIKKNELNQQKIDEMYRIKNKLFHYIHQRIRSYGKSHKSQKVGWYKRRWGYEITQFYFDKDKRKIKGDLDKIIKKLNDELTMVRNLSKKQFRKKFSHKTPKYKQRIQKEIWWERSDDNVKHYTSPPFKGVVKDLL